MMSKHLGVMRPLQMCPPSREIIQLSNGSLSTPVLIIWVKALLTSFIRMFSSNNLIIKWVFAIPSFYDLGQDLGLKENTYHSPLPLRVFLAGQQTNSTPLKTSMPQGRSMAKDRSFIPLSEQALPAVEFHWSKFQHLVWL